MEDGEEKEAVKEEKKLAVVIKLQLASSQYATMALRELMNAGGVKAYKPEFMGGR
jgi:tRNA pseudouridine13 synthase